MAASTLAALDSNKFRVSAALWAPDPLGGGSFLIFSGLVESLGQEAAQAKLEDALRGSSGTVPIAEIELHPYMHPMSQDLRAGLKVDGVSGRLTNVTIGGNYFGEATVYRAR
jgi:hypothetical protein